MRPGMTTRRLLRPHVTAALLVAAVAMLPACGGDGGGGQLSAAEFRTQADKICADAQTEFEAVEQPQSEEELTEYLQKVVPILRDQVEKLDDLNPPDELQEDWDRAIELNRESLEKAEEAQQAAEDGDQQRVQEILEEADTNEEELDQLAQDLGLQTCGEG
jgi:hypothetical protein